MSKVGGRDSPEVAETLADQLGHPDRVYREEVLSQLIRTEHGRKLLAGRLVEAESADVAWPLARALATLAGDDPEVWAKELFPQAAKYLETGDRRADPLLFVLREGDAAGLRDRLEKKAASLVAKKAFESARLLYLALTRDPAAGFPYRMGLAACGLKVSAKELGQRRGRMTPASASSGTGSPGRGSGCWRNLRKRPGWGRRIITTWGSISSETRRRIVPRLRCVRTATAHQPIPAHKLAAGAKHKLASAGLTPKKGNASRGHRSPPGRGCGRTGRAGRQGGRQRAGCRGNRRSRRKRGSSASSPSCMNICTIDPPREWPVT